MKQVFAVDTMTAKAIGKTILIGEHAALYGFPALAVALPGIGLEITIQKLDERFAPQTWEEAFSIIVRGKTLEITQSHRVKLTEALQTALSSAGGDFLLSDFQPQYISVKSQIPLGAGMGGSAALSTAMVRLVDCARGNDGKNLAQRANTVDCVFHGIASGLDTAAIAADGQIIEFRKNKGFSIVPHKTELWLVLIDSAERASTFDMVEKVKFNKENNVNNTSEVLQQLGECSERARTYLELGDLSSLGIELDAAHHSLFKLGVSTPKIDSIVQELKRFGAAGAKLTGGGGGGVVLGLFLSDPVAKLQDLAQLGQVFYSRVAPYALNYTLQG